MDSQNNNKILFRDMSLISFKQKNTIIFYKISFGKLQSHMEQFLPWNEDINAVSI